MAGVQYTTGSGTHYVPLGFYCLWESGHLAASYSYDETIWISSTEQREKYTYVFRYSCASKTGRRRVWDNR